MQWILVLMIFSNISTGLNVPQTMSITTVAGFTTHQSCEYTGEAWKKTKQDYDREYECLPADQK
jgi:hypothetical protein